MLFLPPITCLLSLPAHAQEQEDLRRILDQRNQHQAIQHEQLLLKDQADSTRPTITIDGKTYSVGHNADDLGHALYLSLQHQRWGDAQIFLNEYLTLPDRDPMLVHYAQGVMARLLGHYAQAQREFEALLERQPDFLPGRLELARVLFEDHQDIESKQLFVKISATIDARDTKTAGVRKTIQTFLAALDNRSAWNGSFALGPGWTDNLNRSSASSLCLLYIGDGCYVSRTTPNAIVSSGVDYDANFNKRIALRGHHGLYFRSLLFGQSWRDNSAYDELSSTTQAGYSYISGRQNIALAPSFDYYAWGNQALYAAWGLHGEWSWTLSPKSLLKFEGDWKDLRYRAQLYADNYDGITRSLYATYFRSLSQHWTLFGGVDITDAAAAQAPYGSLQKGVRLGASLQWPDGFSSTLFASRRWRGYDAYNATLGSRRDDREDNVTLIVKATRWAFAGFTPVLTLRRNTIASNVDWLYTYDKNVASLKLEHTF
ncbi:MAG TPA: surface lipoprotein assembly modifier [Burkholderiaceae bacterium]